MPGRTNQGLALEVMLLDYAHSQTALGTQVSVGWMDKITSLQSSHFLGMLNDVHVIQDILQAQRDGFDAVIIRPHWDPGLFPHARSHWSRFPGL